MSSPRTINLIVLDWAWALKNANTKKGNPIFLNMNVYLRQANKIRFYAWGTILEGKRANSKNDTPGNLRSTLSMPEFSIQSNYKAVQHIFLKDTCPHTQCWHYTFIFVYKKCV